MKSTLLLLSLAATSLMTYQGGKTALSTHEKTLKEAKSLEATYTVQNLPGAPVEYKLAFSRPALMRIETPSHLVVSDGTKLWDLDKEKNTFTEVEGGADALKGVFGSDDLWPWSGFFLPEQFKLVKMADAGSKRTMKGVEVLDISVTFEDATKTGHVYFDPKQGLARGISLRKGDKEMLIMAKDLKLNGAPDASLFVFSAPAGAKKADAVAAGSDLTYRAVAPILERNCLSCHGLGNPKGGYSVASYQSVLRGVTPGQPEQSRLYRVIAGLSPPRMPKNAPPLSQGDQETIKQWIAAGAKQ